MKLITSALILAITGMAAANEEKPHLSSVGPERELGVILENCDNFLACGFNQNDEYRVCYYGIPFISEPQELCWRNTPLRNAAANSLRVVGRLECGGCP